MSAALTLVSHTLCPYVQRAAIALTEKSVPFERIYIDLADKPGWFTDLSPLGKVPVLKVAQDGRESAIFESAVILEYIEETLPHPLHPSDPLDRARHRSWIEYGAQILNRIGAVYSAPDDAALTVEKARLDQMLERLEEALDTGPWFAGAEFSLVDAVYGPIFRYFDVLDRIPAAAMPSGLPKARAWRKALAERPSVVAAVSPDYPALLTEFLRRRGKALSRAMVPA
ncbi:MAG: glutathione S-transferase family protein [Alphaproteobacteria bacterium]|nr:glutathione S-transferase family protein [Alphaproteobacteria bacterium]MBO6862083.1 glutathione S-transferase family protein [Alphaproteobacteria bacterium]